MNSRHVIIKKSQILPRNGFCRRMILIFMLWAFSLQSQAVSTTHYVYFNDWTVHVFPDSCLLNYTITAYTYSFTALDGKVYTYNRDQIASVTSQPQRKLPTITSFKFEKKHNYQIITDATGVIDNDFITTQVAGIGKRLTATFELSNSQARLYDGNGELQSISNRLRYDDEKILTAGYPGDLILSRVGKRAYSMKQYGRDYTINVTFLTDQATSVPRIDINTVGGVDISSKEYYLDAQIIINGMGVFPSMTDSVKVKGRGNNSWSSNPKAKNPYRLKFANKVKPLGLTKGKNWVLIANKNKGSMLTNAYGMKAASLIGTPAVNHIIPVDLYVNGTYKGNYNFTEKVGLANNSVDIDTEDVAALLELDSYYDESDDQKFRSSPYNLPVNIKSPEFEEDETQLTLSLIRQRFNRFLMVVKYGGDLSDHVDINYLARYLMVNDLIGNKEIFHPKSVYCYNENILDNECHFIFGPVWDLDWAFGYNGYRYSYFNEGATIDFYDSTTEMAQNAFFRALRYNPIVVKQLYKLWQEFMDNGLDELCEYCEDYYLYAKPSLEKSVTAYEDPIDYAQQSVNAAIWIRQRANYIFDKIQQENTLPGDANQDGLVTIADVTTLIDYLLGGNPTDMNERNADVDQNSVINMADVTTLIDMLISSK